MLCKGYEGCRETDFCPVQIGMPHRGRLNVLCNLLQKPAGLLFSEMQQSISDFHVGDVQYHQGTSSHIFVEDLVSQHF